jgi:hypothetical protein
MTDLINRVNNLESGVVAALVEKYKEPLQEAGLKSAEDVPYLAFVINLSVNYINAKHSEENAEWKAWGVVLIKRLFETEKVKTKEEIFEHLNKFYDYKKSEYEKYVSNIAMYSDEYWRDVYFIDKYVKNL